MKRRSCERMPVFELTGEHHELAGMALPPIGVGRRRHAQFHSSLLPSSRALLPLGRRLGAVVLNPRAGLFAAAKNEHQGAEHGPLDHAAGRPEGDWPRPGVSLSVVDEADCITSSAVLG